MAKLLSHRCMGGHMEYCACNSVVTVKYMNHLDQGITFLEVSSCYGLPPLVICPALSFVLFFVAYLLYLY